MASVELSHVHKIYEGGFKAVDDFTLHIADREFIVLVGPSGCGKSTTLRMIAGLEDITSGTIAIGGRLMNDVPPKDRDIAMVFQSYALYPAHVGVREHGLRAQPAPHAQGRPSTTKSQARRRERWGSTHLLDKQARANCRAGNASAWPWAAPSCATRSAFSSTNRCRTWTPSCGSRCAPKSSGCTCSLGSTTVYVTHDQEEAITLGDRVVVMKDGVVHQCAGPLEIYHRPANRFVAGFLGTPPMNFFAGRLIDETGLLFFDEGTAKLPVPAWAVPALRERPAGIPRWSWACGPKPSSFLGRAIRVQRPARACP